MIIILYSFLKGIGDIMVAILLILISNNDYQMHRSGGSLLEGGRLREVV